MSDFSKATVTDFSKLTQEEFDALVAAKVEEKLSSREEAEARREAEAALAEAQEVFETLRASLEQKDAKLREYEEALAQLESNPSAAEVAANEKILALEAQLEEATRRAEVAEAALTTLAKEETAASRMSELDELGLALEGDAAEAQYAKVREMSEEDFDNYKQELLALKSRYASQDTSDSEPIEAAALTDDEINMIAQSLGCDPADAKCVSLVREVAQKMAEVSKVRKTSKGAQTADTGEAATAQANSGDDAAAPKKEVASTFSLGEAISRSLDQSIRPGPTLKEEYSQAWAEYYAAKRGNNK